MSNYITMDGGTTNTRIALISDNQVLDILRYPVGARIAIDDRQVLLSVIKEGIVQLTAKYSNLPLDGILASGLLTSEFGLCEVPHIALPAGVEELHNALCPIDFGGYPVTLIPGVKIISDRLDKVCMMRGEETELFGLMSLLPKALFENSVIVLPGSHSKMIYLDRDLRITSFTSLLTGEMIAALSGYTILKDAVDLNQNETVFEQLLAGYKYCHTNGLNEALLKVRFLKNLFHANTQETYSFFLGAILAGEIDLLLKSQAKQVVIAGRKQIKEPMADLIRALSDKKVTVIIDDIVDKSTFLGMKAIVEYHK